MGSARASRSGRSPGSEPKEFGVREPPRARQALLEANFFAKWWSSGIVSPLWLSLSDSTLEEERRCPGVIRRPAQDIDCSRVRLAKGTGEGRMDGATAVEPVRIKRATAGGTSVTVYKQGGMIGLDGR